ncbi:aspartate ammonia-lyase [Candidatus Woesearchaeota archaeon]|nr:aspartate ammonia-lyase [Candidatus Woesearchaeota archaeon]
MDTRDEHDFLGPVKVPKLAYYGSHTERAKENFQISRQMMHPALRDAICHYKIAAAMANLALKKLEPFAAKAIEDATQETIRGWLDAHLVISYLQAGAGTPWNMNVNEVIANRATELVGGKKGEYLIHPNDHVNMGQSTNNVIPTAMRLAALSRLYPLLCELHLLEQSYLRKAKEFDKVITAGRTHLQDAVPIRIGQEFHAWGVALGKCRDRIKGASTDLYSLNTGGSAIGTGLNTHPKFAELVLDHLKGLTKQPLVLAKDPIEATSSMADIAAFHASLKIVSNELIRLCNDLRLLASGPNTAIHELNLPAVEPGSSIMPGKVNPSVPECVTMTCFEVLGNDHMIELCAQNSQLQLNVWMPLLAHKLLESMDHLTAAMRLLREKCIAGITVNKDVCQTHFESSLGLATVLSPFIGYEKAAEVVKESQRTGKTVREIVIGKKIFSKSDLDKLLDPMNVTKPNVK